MLTSMITQSPGTTSRYELFKRKAEEARAEVFHVSSPDEALGFLTTFLKSEGVAEHPQQAALFATCPFLDEARRQTLASIPGIHFEVSLERASVSRIGVSQMGWALADTGTLVQNATAVDQRLVSTLPAIHIALVPTGRILPDLPALLSQVEPASCGYLAFITGPSRTADIERVLTIGVHGPERLVILFIDGLDAL